MNLIQMTIISMTVGKNPLEERSNSHSQQKSQNAVLECNLKKTGQFQFISKANHSKSQKSKSMHQPLMLKKIKLKGSVKIYKTVKK